jgi:hypothetical protein
MTTSEDERAAFERAVEWHARTHTARASLPEPPKDRDSLTQLSRLYAEALFKGRNDEKTLDGAAGCLLGLIAALSAQERPSSMDHGEGGYPTERAGEAVQRPAGGE